ncbi:hypothetical protein Pcinc_035676 [Petrolisthes cinctipes]|uniref:Uncharacterized protein n=1 Tax=Petrolisthes cinctipes TaxID=88211 RepID=A0AAE1BWH6_PETCI|nr:hypothetical protein Pcinc_035676 [Petrolisthes cinctipes]
MARSAQSDPSHYSSPSSLEATSTPCSMLTKSTIKGASALALPCPPRRWLLHVVGNVPRSHQHRHKDQGTPAGTSTLRAGDARVQNGGGARARGELGVDRSIRPNIYYQEGRLT